MQLKCLNVLDAWLSLILTAGEAHDLPFPSHADNLPGRLVLALQICTRGTAAVTPACASVLKAGSRQKKRGKSPKQQFPCWNSWQQMPSPQPLQIPLLGYARKAHLHTSKNVYIVSAPYACLTMP